MDVTFQGTRVSDEDLLADIDIGSEAVVSIDRTSDAKLLFHSLENPEDRIEMFGRTDWAEFESLMESPGDIQRYLERNGVAFADRKIVIVNWKKQSLHSINWKSVSLLRFLTEFDLSHNQINDSFDTAHLPPNLKTLRLNFNGISKMTFGGVHDWNICSWATMQSLQSIFDV